MPQVMTDWHAKEKRIEAALLKVRAKQDKLRAEADLLSAELEQLKAARDGLVGAGLLKAVL